MKKFLSALLCVITVMSGVVLTYAGSYYGKDVNVIEKFSFDCDPIIIRGRDI